MSLQVSSKGSWLSKDRGVSCRPPNARFGGHPASSESIGPVARWSSAATAHHRGMRFKQSRLRGPRGSPEPPRNPWRFGRADERSLRARSRPCPLRRERNAGGKCRHAPWSPSSGRPCRRRRGLRPGVCQRQPVPGRLHRYHLWNRVLRGACGRRGDGHCWRVPHCPHRGRVAPRGQRWAIRAATLADAVNSSISSTQKPRHQDHPGQGERGHHPTSCCRTPNGQLRTSEPAHAALRAEFDHAAVAAKRDCTWVAPDRLRRRKASQNRTANRTQHA